MKKEETKKDLKKKIEEQDILIIEQDKLIRRCFALLKKTLMDWSFYQKLNYLQIIVALLMGFAIGLIIFA
jgi:hypothetical protein